MMNHDEIADLYNAAVLCYGVESQVDIALEELAECSLAVSKLFKRDYTLSRYHDLASEIADVRIVLDQLQYILREEMAPPPGAEDLDFGALIEQAYNYKLERLHRRIHGVPVSVNKEEV